MRAKFNIAFLLALVLPAAILGALSVAQAAPIDASSPAGPVTGVIVVFLPAGGVGPAVVPGPVIVPYPTTVLPRGRQFTPIVPGVSMTPGPALPTILLLTPTTATGSLVVPVHVPLAGSGVSLTQLQLVIPGPNPSQNTAISLAQLLNSVLTSLQRAEKQQAPAPGTSAPPVVTVY